MTDARMPDRWLNDRRVMRLSPEHFRSFVLALLWSVSNRTEGLIERDDVPLIPGMTREAAEVFVRAGLWSVHEAGWAVVDYAATQSSRAELEAAERRRVLARERKARQRERQRDQERDGDRDESRGVTRDSLGKARTGQASSSRSGERRRTGTTPRASGDFSKTSAALDNW